MAIELGKRFVDEKSGVEVLVTKAANSPDWVLYADEQEMKLQTPRPLPASD